MARKKSSSRPRVGGLKSRKFGKSRARVTKVGRQTGSSDTSKDRKRTALLPGRRVSRSGNRYTENRKNRSDRRNSRV